MNIWILNHHAGETGRHPSFAEHLTKLNSKITLFSSSFAHNRFEETKKYIGEKFIEEEDNGYKRIYIKTPKYKGNGYRRLINQLSFSKNSYKTGMNIYANGNKPDIVMGSSVHLFTGLTAYFLARRTNSKFVFEIRDLWPKTLVDLGALNERSLITKFFFGLEKFLYNKADLIVSVLPDANRYIEGLGIVPRKIIHIPNGINIKYMDESLRDNDIQEKVTSLLESFKEEFIVSFTGAHGKANGLDTLIEAAKILQKEEKGDIKTRFLFFGEGPEKKKLMQMAKDYSLKNVTFKDPVPRTFVPHILRQSNVCLFHLVDTPVFNYGISSNKIFDYMYSGKPVIFAVNASNDFAKLAKCGITIRPSNPSELAEGISKIKSMDKQKLNDYGVNGKNYVKANHSFNELAKNMKVNFDELLKSD